MSHKILATHRFVKELKKLKKKYPSLNQDLQSLKRELTDNPRSGTPLGEYYYKTRLKTKSKGKRNSGGERVITYLIKWSAEIDQIYLLSIYDKSDISSISR